MKGHLSTLRRQVNQGAFSILELLVATTLSVLMLTLLLTLLSGVLDTWTSTAARSETFGEARAALHLLERELNLIVPPIHHDGEEVDDLITKLETTEGETVDVLAFLCKVPHEGQPSSEAFSDICGVTYFIAPETDQPNAPNALFRRLIPSEETFTKLGTAPAELFTDSCKVDNLAEVVAQNVIGFKISQRDQELKLIPPTETVGAPPPLSDSAETPPVAAYVEVTLKVISSRSAQSYFDPTIPAIQKERIALQESREFTFRVARRHPLSVLSSNQ